MAGFSLRSAAFEDEGVIPRIHTCDGKDLSPALSWSGQPVGTASLTLVVEDPDAPAKTWVHWVLIDLPATLSGLPEGVPGRPRLEGGGTHGVNDFGKLGYGGPCPPSGTHRYVFTLCALDKRLDLPAGSTREDLKTAMRGHVLEETRLTGRYSRSR